MVGNFEDSRKISNGFLSQLLLAVVPDFSVNEKATFVHSALKTLATNTSIPNGVFKF